jgi:hypothetical protein
VTGLLLVAMVACSEVAGPADVAGTWAGDDAQLIIEGTEATFEAPCHVGSLTLPDRFVDGRFDAAGTVTFRGGAPPVEPPVARPATYTGEVRGDRITLVIGPPELGLGPYELRRGAEIQIPLCP